MHGLHYRDGVEPLFDVEHESPLPPDFRHHRHWLPADAADRYLAVLTSELAWAQRPLVIGGRRVMTPRLTYWVGPEPFRYSGGVEPIHAWTAELNEIRAQANSAAGVEFNSVLANLYRDGNDSMGAHRDDEPEFGARPVIASVNLGATRDFAIKHDITGERHVIALGHGDVLVMSGRSQLDWSHSVPKRARVTQPRINLTFRQWKSGN